MRSSDGGIVHVIGAGVAGLAAAVRLAGMGRRVALHEATARPGGRCRSFYDHATGMVIDNGTHLLLSGNRAALDFAARIGSTAAFDGPDGAEFRFVNLASARTWTVRLSDGRLPWWIFDRKARVPQTRARDYLPLMRLIWESGDRRLAEAMPCDGPLYERFVAPLLLAALNIDPLEGSTGLASALLRETLALGGRACRPLIAPLGIGNALIDPAVGYLRSHGITVGLRHALHALHVSDGRVAQLDFGNDAIALGGDDAVILAVPATMAAKLVPGLQTPSAFRSIVNAHFRIHPSPRHPCMIGVINGTAEWIFALPGRIAVTVSDAGRLFGMPREQLAETLWNDVATAVGYSGPMPPWQIVRERRATFAATPEENAKRPGAQTVWCNLFLAGDWTATGLPATIEGAVRSGNRAADLAMQYFDRSRAAA